MVFYAKNHIEYIYLDATKRMEEKMSRRIRAKYILRLRANGLSRNAIAKAIGSSKTSVMDVFNAAERNKVNFNGVENKTNEEIYAMFFPERCKNKSTYEDPDWEYVHKELAKTGVTLKLLYQEYLVRNLGNNKPSMSYDNFSKRYRKFTTQNEITSRVGKPSGRIIEVDLAGPTLNLVEAGTGEISKVCLFVGCLPFSRMVYVEPSLSMNQESWLLIHVHMFSYFDGVTPCIIPDNLKTGLLNIQKMVKSYLILNTKSLQFIATLQYYQVALVRRRIKQVLKTKYCMQLVIQSEH